MKNFLSTLIIGIILFINNAYGNIEILNEFQSSNTSCTGAIEILAEGTAGPFSITVLKIEDNGSSTPIESTSNINGTYLTANPLCPGTYSIVVTNAFGCSTILPAEVKACGIITIEENPLNPKITPPLSCGSEDGGFRFIDGPTGGAGNYSYLWDNGTTALDIELLGVGTYLLTVTDDIGCTAEFSFEMPGPNVPEILAEATDIQPACEGVANGFIGIGVNPNNSGPYDFAWSNGHTTIGDVLSSIGNIATGLYTVTITNQDGGCTITETFNVGEVPDEGPFSIIGQSFNTCPNENTGSINTTVSGGNPPYEIVWSNGMTGAVITTLSSGSYIITATDYCGRIETQSYNVGMFPSMTITLESISGCPETGEIDVTVSGGSPPLTYQWSNGQTSEDATNLNNGSIELVVTDIEGCTESESFEVQLGEIEFGESSPACDVLDNGVQDITITKATNNLPITILLDNSIDIPVSQTENPLNVPISGLAKGPHDLLVTIGGCQISESFTIETISASLENTTLDGNVCTSDRKCGEVFLGEFQYPMVIDVQNGSGGNFQKCEAPILCNGQVMETRKYKKKWVKAFEYFTILNVASNSGRWDAEYIGRLIRFYNDKTDGGRNICQRVRYCPANLRAWHFGNPIGISQESGGFAPAGSGCTRVVCKDRPDYTVCLDDLEIPGDFYDLITPNLVICNPRSWSLYQLVYWHRLNLLDNIISGTELYDELEYYSNPANTDEKLHCAMIVFCASDFKVVYNNYDDVICPNMPNFIENSCSIDEYPLAGFTTVHCAYPTDCTGCLNPYSQTPHNIYHSITNFPFKEPSHISEVKNKYISDTYNSEILSNLSILKNEGVCIPQGIINSDSTMFLYNYNHFASSLFKVESSEILFNIDDWDTQQLMYIEIVDSLREFNLSYEDSLSTWVSYIGSDTLLNVKYLSKTNSEIFIGGVFHEELNYDSTLIHTSINPSLFFLKTSFDGNLTDTIILENINIDEVLITENRAGKVIITGKHHDNWVKLNDVITPMNDDEGYFVLSIDENGQMDFVSDIYAENTFELIDVSQAIDQSRFALSFYGSGIIEINGTQVFSNNEKHIVTAIVNKDGTFRGIAALESTNINSSKFDMLFTKDENIMMGLTYIGSIDAFGDTLVSTGNHDIALMKLDTSATLQWTKTYGTADEENVSHLFYDSGVLYFGGEFSGAETQRTIGGYHFINLTTLDQRAYISYVLDDDTNSSSVTERDIIKNNENIPPANVSISDDNSILVSPNPFMQQINVDVLSDAIKRVEVSNAIGQLISLTEITGLGRYQVDLGMAADGLYFVKAFDKDGRFVTLKKMIKTQ